MHAQPLSRPFRPAAMITGFLCLFATLISLAAEEFRPTPTALTETATNCSLSQLLDVRRPLTFKATSSVNGEEYHPQVTAGPPDKGLQVHRTALRPRYELTPTSEPKALSAVRAPAAAPRQLREPAVLPQPGPVGLNSATDDELRIKKISSRYIDSRMLSFLRSTSLRQEFALIQEASDLIDTRHVNPPAYEKRTPQALHGLMLAVENPDFLNVAGVSPAPEVVARVQGQLETLAKRPTRSANETLAVVQQAAEIVSAGLKVPKELVVLEFLNSTVDTLDRYSAFMPARSSNGPGAESTSHQQVASLEEHIVGIGVELKTHAQGALVLATLEGGPAQRAGLRVDDVIVALDGVSANGKNLNQVADGISGAAGTLLKLTVLRQAKEATITVRREPIYISSVTNCTLVDRTTGYLRIKQFSESTAEDLEKEMWKLYRAGMQQIVLDLRGNPGGLLTEAVDVSNMFVPRGTIVSTRGRNMGDNMEEHATLHKTWKLPLVVLVDDHSASASEIFAAAVQENGRGVVVGRRSYGKGTVQTHFPLNSVAGELKLTTAKFYSPNGREMAGAGVTPDIAINDEPQTAGDFANDPDLRAAAEAFRSGRPAELAASAPKGGRGQRNTRFEELPAP